jgi:hypothetical protein
MLAHNEEIVSSTHFDREEPRRDEGNGKRFVARGGLEQAHEDNTFGTKACAQFEALASVGIAVQRSDFDEKSFEVIPAGNFHRASGKLRFLRLHATVSSMGGSRRCAKPDRARRPEKEAFTVSKTRQSGLERSARENLLRNGSASAFAEDAFRAGCGSRGTIRARQPRKIAIEPRRTAFRPGFVDIPGRFAIICKLLASSAYPEWLREQAPRSHSNLAQLPRC